MPTLVFACGVECGIAASNAPHWSAISGTGSIDTGTVRTGSRSLRLNPTAATGFVETASWTAASVVVARFYIRFATLPSVDVPICTFSLGGAEGVWFKSSDGKLYPGYTGPTFGSTGASVTTGVWYRVDLRINASANPWLIDVQVDGTALTQLSETKAAGTIARLAFGYSGGNFTADMFFDDYVVSHTSGDYPLGAGFVKSYIPDADGTHNVAGANDFEFSLTGTDITNATTTAYTLIDDRPLPTTAVDFINGIAPPNATDYVEWQYEDSTESMAPDGVEAIVMRHTNTGAGTCNFTVTLREHAGGTSADIRTGALSASTSLVADRAFFATVPGTSDAWTTTKFNALRSRFLVSDASPDPYIDAAMLEAAFTDAPPATPEQKNWIRTGHVQNMYGVRPGRIAGRSW